MSAPVYSQRLGPISEDQFRAATARFGLGDLLSARPANTGLFGQNVFITTSAGAFVLRGAPHWVMGPNDMAWRRQDRWQFTKEAYFARRLHEETQAQAPWPYRLDEASDIFGWPYAIMPRMPGACFDERSILTALEPDDRRQVAAALGATLAEMQTLTSPFAGDVDTDTLALTPDPAGYRGYLIYQSLKLADLAAVSGVLSQADRDWMDDIARDARGLGERPNAFVHGDYKLDNLTMAPDGGRWRVSGVFDLHTARFGDGAHDLVRQTCAYLDSEPTLARVFVDAYRAESRSDVDFTPWLPLYVLNERLAIWQAFVRADARPSWSRDRTFRDWADRYLSKLLGLF